MLTKVIPSYLYVQYNDDEDLAAFVSAYNQLAQDYVTAFYELGLPVYTQLSGGLLDWVGLGVYGIPRPLVPAAAPTLKGPFNTYDFNDLEYNGSVFQIGTQFVEASDDIYKRVITWNFYKGDGYQFTLSWLKRRIARFIRGVNGTDPNISETYNVSVIFSGGNVVAIKVSGLGNPLLSAILAYLISSGALQLPFQYTFDVDI